MKLRTLFITLLLFCGLTLSVSADDWSDTGLPGQLPPGWSIQGVLLHNAEEPQIQGLIRFVFLDDLNLSLTDEVEKLIVERNLDRSEYFSVTYGSTRVEMIDLRGSHVAFAKYNGNVYTFLLTSETAESLSANQDEFLTSEAAEILAAYQDELLTHIFGPTQQYDEKGKPIK